MPHVIDHEKDRSGVHVRLSEANTGCSDAELLRMAENCEVLLFAALRKFSAVSQNTLGERHPGFPWMKTHGQDVELLPQYARDIRLFGQAEITHFPADLPEIGDESLWFWRLEAPQTISIENLVIADGHVSNLSTQAAPAGAPESVAPRRPMGRQIFQENEILRVIRELGYDPKALPKDTSGKDGIKAKVRAMLHFSVSVFDKAWERLAKNKDIIKPK